MPTDSICGMLVEESPNTPHATVNGTTYYSCSESCLQTYIAPELELRALKRNVLLKYSPKSPARYQSLDRHASTTSPDFSANRGGIAATKSALTVHPQRTERKHSSTIFPSSFRTTTRILVEYPQCRHKIVRRGPLIHPNLYLPNFEEFEEHTGSLIERVESERKVLRLSIYIHVAQNQEPRRAFKLSKMQNNYGIPHSAGIIER
jgi:YHS domain-containing protein